MEKYIIIVGKKNKNEIYIEIKVNQGNITKVNKINMKRIQKNKIIKITAIDLFRKVDFRYRY